jgi:hypothetical protein
VRKKKSIDQADVSKNELESKKEIVKSSSRLVKKVLVCPSAKCKYQKTIMKKQLTETDKICPRCNKVMKVK